ncbi:mannose-1-phosphate guanylyltransferase/mannose-6-phosphate isomerase [Nitrobacteraceae bacterium UC4446_H13]
MFHKIIPLIMCGGAGTRLWPLSRENRPKQFLNLFGRRSTFQETALRVASSELFDRPIVVTASDYRALVQSQLEEIGCQADILLESARRDSGPAIAAGTVFATRRDPRAVVLALAADHIVQDAGAFVAACTSSLEASFAGYIVTFGVKPERPATEYGYISPGQVIDWPIRAVTSFVEKPDVATATCYVQSGYLWNSGNFMFRADILLDEYQAVDADSIEAVKQAVDGAEQDQTFVSLNKKSFERAKPISIDYAIMERTKRAAVIPVAFGWSDVGSWRTVWKLSSKDAQGNAKAGEAMFENANNCYVSSDKAFVAVEGIDELVVVATQDAILVSRHADSMVLKKLVAKLKNVAPQLTKASVPEAALSGEFHLLEAKAHYQVRRVVMRPGERFPLRQDRYQTEHWVIVRGVGLIDRNGLQNVLREGESILVPGGAAHWLENSGSTPLEMIAVQTGLLLG